MSAVSTLKPLKAEAQETEAPQVAPEEQQTESAWVSELHIYHSFYSTTRLSYKVATLHNGVESGSGAMRA